MPVTEPGVQCAGSTHHQSLVWMSAMLVLLGWDGPSLRLNVGQRSRTPTHCPQYTTVRNVFSGGGERDECLVWGLGRARGHLRGRAAVGSAAGEEEPHRPGSAGRT